MTVAAPPRFDAEIGAAESKMSDPTEDYTWVWVDSTYLREQAQRCIRMARDCPHQPTSHELESLGIDLMQKAADLDQLQQGEIARPDH